MKSRTFKMFSARAAMLMLATLFSAGAWAQSQDLLPPENEAKTLDNAYQRPDGAYKLIMHGASDADAHIGEGAKLSAYEIVYKRDFTVGVPATVIFPFSTAKMTVRGGNFYEFAGVEWDSEQGQWVASMTQVDVAENPLAQNHPYIVLPTESKLEFDLRGDTVKYYTRDNAAVTCNCWSFVGTYKKLYWIEAALDPTKTEVAGEFQEVVETGDYYGFAAFARGSVSAGEFVKCSGNGYYEESAFIKPLRAYLKFVGDENCPANNDTKMLTRQSGNNLPTSIAVVLRDKNGEVTSVGTTSEKTGEITFEGWFTTDGIKLPAEPTKSGIYIHNGKKVVVK